MPETGKERPVVLGEGNEIGRISSPRDGHRVCTLGKKQIDDAVRSIERCDMKRCPSLLVFGVDVGSL